MSLPDFSLRQLLEAGVHFGHQTHRWNPRMGEFIYGSRNGIHIVDLTQTVPMLDAALNKIRKTVAEGGRILFVGTKRQAQKPVAEAAQRSAQFHVNHRWLGGTLTNWKTVSNSIGRLKEIDDRLESGTEGMTKKERLGIEREQRKLQASLGGIREMGGVPDLLFVIDVQKEALAVAEANKLKIPVVAIVDTNCAPEGIDYIVPGNDDASRAIALYCDLAARAALAGVEEQMGSEGVDVGELAEIPTIDAGTAEGAEDSGGASEAAAASEVGDAAETTEATDVGDAAEASDATGATEAGEATEAAEASDAAETSEEAEASDVTDASDAAEATDDSGSAEASDAADAAEASDAAGATEPSDSAEASEVTEADDATESSDAGEVDESSTDQSLDDEAVAEAESKSG